jgi:hypothetical protein
MPRSKEDAMPESDSHETPLEQVTGEKDVHPEEERTRGAAPEPEDTSLEANEQEPPDSSPGPNAP